MSRISIIIPVFNEEEHIGKLVAYLKKHGQNELVEVFVIDGGSTDQTQKRANEAGAGVFLSPQKGRAAQMNFGAAKASGDILYFVHADTLPPASFATDILASVKKGYEMGRYLSKYKSKNWLLKLNAWLSRFDTFEGMGGDQTLFITRKLFDRAGGFDGGMKIMEEFDFCARARKLGKYNIVPKAVLISARKYEANGWLKVQRANFTIVKMYKKGASQEAMVAAYKRLLNYR